MKSSEDFLLVVLHAHAVSAANTICRFRDIDSVTELSQAIVTNYTLLPQFGKQPAAKKDKDASKDDYPDQVYLGTPHTGTFMAWIS